MTGCGRTDCIVGSLLSLYQSHLKNLKHLLIFFFNQIKTFKSLMIALNPFTSKFLDGVGVCKSLCWIILRFICFLLCKSNSNYFCHRYFKKFISRHFCSSESTWCFSVSVTSTEATKVSAENIACICDLLISMKPKAYLSRSAIDLKSLSVKVFNSFTVR